MIADSTLTTTCYKPTSLIGGDTVSIEMRDI